MLGMELGRKHGLRDEWVRVHSRMGSGKGQVRLDSQMPISQWKEGGHVTFTFHRLAGLFVLRKERRFHIGY